MADMRIRDNSSGRIASGHLGRTQGQLGKTLEKLSSGYRINRSADDAAGLAISEKMRALITGLEQAEQNSEDGLSLVQVGEAALSEIHTVLNRIVELSTTSANGTYTDERDRAALQKELNQLYDEVERISKTANFNGIKLFQDKGLEYENIFEGDVQANSLAAFQETAPQVQTLDQVLAGTKKGEVSIIYTETYDQVTTSQSPEGAATTPSGIVIGGKDLSDILKTEIIPNTVQNIMKSYPAFSYLNGSSIGIGLEYFSQGAVGGSTTLAYVKAGAGSSGTISGDGTLASREDFITYTLGVNTSVLAGITDRDGLQKLEATIAHEMIHAFMDEAVTSGMFGKTAVSNGNLTAEVAKFPDWFIEGMAQTASGPDNWLSYMRITGTSSDAEIAAAIGREQLGSGSTASQYGTGYLACMYLGASIAGGGTPAATVDAATVSAGLTKLFNEVIGGKSLNDAISTLTNGKFRSTSDFAAKFNTGPAEVGSFVRSLLAATGNGRGGIISGDLKAVDLTADTDLGNSVSLFQLDTTTSGVKNIYPKDYPVYSGGATSTGGTAPTDFTPAAPTPPLEYGDLIVTGAQASDIDYDANTGVLTVKAADDIKISMKAAGTTSTTNKIILQGNGKVTLSGVQLSNGDDALQIDTDTEVRYEGKNHFSGITLNGTINTAFKGSGQLKIDKFTSDMDDTVRFDGGAVIVGDPSVAGSNSIHAKDVVIDNASVAASITTADGTVKNSAGTVLKDTDMPWTRLSGLNDVAAISYNGNATGAVLDFGQGSKLWLDPGLAKNVLTVTDSTGAKRVLAAEYDAAAGSFNWLDSIKPFTVSGGTEGTDWEYDADGQTLVIKTNKPLTISGGKGADPAGKEFSGRIRLADNIAGDVSLTLGEIHCETDTGSAFDLGEGNHVSLTLTDGATSIFAGGRDYAGIAVGAGTDLTINGTDAGKLIAEGGNGSAGIGSSGAAKLTDQTSSITIKGGNIEAKGGNNGAGIGAGNGSSFGDITIEKGIVKASGGVGGAGIGGANDSKVGDIKILDGHIEAKSAAHGAGIGGGWGSTATNGDITIEGGDITASSMEHGTGIGAGCQGTSGKITIKGGNVSAEGGDDGAGIGASWIGKCGAIEITGGSVDAKGGRNGAGIGAGSSGSRVMDTILIDTTGTVNAEGGMNGVGIGSGYGGSSCGDIEIRQGTVNAKGSTDSTGIGAGRDSSSGNVTIGDPSDPDKRVNVDAIGGMTHNGGNIMSYGDGNHTQAGTLTVTGDNTTVRPGTAGEGLYSTSGAVDENGENTYAYPVYLFKTDPPLDAGAGLDGTGLPLPAGVDPATVKITATSAGGKTKDWTQGLIHEPEKNYAFLWMGGEDQTLDITYTNPDGTPGQVSLDLKFHPDAGVFRIPTQPDPPAAQKPEYVTQPVTPDIPGPKDDSYAGGIILHIGAGRNDTLGVPRYYLSAKALGMDRMNITTQEKARQTIGMVGDAIDRVSAIRGSYGALSKRLEHNQQYLNNTIENTQAAESRVRDVDMAKEYMGYIRLSILSQSSQSMLAHSKQDTGQILQLLR